MTDTMQLYGQYEEQRRNEDDIKNRYDHHPSSPVTGGEKYSRETSSKSISSL